MYQFKRSDRVRELLRHEISLYVQEIKDPRLGFVTITDVHISSDLTDAKVYFSVLGSEEDKKLSSEILAQSVPALRRFLGRKLESLYRPPHLSFIYDHTPERAQRVMTLLNQLSRESGTPGNGSTSPKLERKTSRKTSPRFNRK